MCDIMSTTSDTAPEVCSICLSDVYSDVHVVVTSCNHVFHVNCISRWVCHDVEECADDQDHLSWSCPCCRKAQIMPRPWIRSLCDARHNAFEEENNDNEVEADLHPFYALPMEEVPLLIPMETAQAHEVAESTELILYFVIMIPYVIALTWYLVVCAAVHTAQPLRWTPYWFAHMPTKGQS